MLCHLLPDEPGRAFLKHKLQVVCSSDARVDEVDVYAWPQNDFVWHGQVLISALQFGRDIMCEVAVRSTESAG